MAKHLPKTGDQLLSALEDRLFLLSRSLDGLHEGDAAHLREVAGHLRNLLCRSSGVEGLIWRLCEQIAVEDWVVVPEAEPLGPEAPPGLRATFSYAMRTPLGSEDGRPERRVSLRHYFEHEEAFRIDGESFTGFDVIDRIANEAGAPHEAGGVAKFIAKANSLRIGGVAPFFAVIETNAQLALQVGERAVAAAVADGYRRRRPPAMGKRGLPIQNKPFKTELELPSTPPPKGRSGRFASTLHLVSALEAIDAGQEALFPPLQAAGITLHTGLRDRRGRIRIWVSADGLPLPYFRCEAILPPGPPSTVCVEVAWIGVSGKLVEPGPPHRGVLR